MQFTKPKRAIGLDIGTHSVKAVQMSRSGGRLFVDEVGYAVVNRDLINADPVMAHANAVSEALAGLSVTKSAIIADLPGQTVVIRYPRISQSAQLDLESAVEREAGQSIPYDLAEVYLDWTLLEELKEGDTNQLKILLVAAKHEVIDSRVQIMNAAEVQFSVLGVDSLALADAAEACDLLRSGETVAMLNVGLTSASIHFIKNGVSNFIRDVAWGARELVQAIAKERRIDYEAAQKVLQDLVSEPMGGAKPAPVPEPEPVKKPVSDVSFDDDPFGEAGGGSLLDPLDDEDMGAKPGAAKPAETDLSSVLSGSLSRMVSEIRRSFDYYEHQLYENPVDRVILTGGVARLSLIADAIREELGVENVEVADPARSGLRLGDNAAVRHLLDSPSQFMVAVGLAARGMAEL
ncbi:MAG: type IV pilus assembly protein PilM [Candidatus Hydrogenedens sp.]|nr:type IV pilus assembly protein PilM [Candidatus Hydrogenedens sp.]